MLHDMYNEDGKRLPFVNFLGALEIVIAQLLRSMN